MATTDSDIAVIKGVFDAFARRDVDRAIAHADPEIVFAAITGEELGRDEPYHGHEGLRAYFRDVAAVWEELLLSPDEFRHVGDCVLVTGRVTARSASRVVSGSTGWIWRLEDGKVVYARVYASAGDAIAALGEPA